MPIPVTPNLQLQLPQAGVYDSLPNWAAIINSNFQKIDALGNPVPVSKLNINADLPFNGFAATELEASIYDDQGGTLGSSFLLAVYASNGDLYYNNSSGTPVQITNGNSLAGVAGTITGMTGGASASFNASTGYTFLGTGGNVAAQFNIGPLHIYDTAAGPPTYSVILKSQASLLANVPLTFPGALPSAPSTFIVQTDGTMLFGKLINGPTTISPATGWTGFSSFSYFSDANTVVHLQGGVTAGGGHTTTIAAAGAIAVPPAADRYFAVPNVTTGACQWVKIGADGSIVLFSSPLNGQSIALDGVSFRAA